MSVQTSASSKIFPLSFLTAVLSVPIFLGAVHLWSFSLSVFILAASFLYYWLSAVRMEAPPLYRTNLDVWIGWYLLFFCLSAAQTKIPYKTAIESFKLLAVLFSFIAALHYCRDRSRVYRFCQALTLLGGFLSILGLLQFLGGFSKDWWKIKYFLSATYANHNHFAGLLEMILPVSLGLITAERGRTKKIFYTFLAVLMGVAFIFTLSRGGVIAMGIALVFFIFLLYRRGVVRGAWAPLVGFFILVVAVVILFGTHPIEQRMESVQVREISEDPSMALRMLAWKSAWQVMLNFLWFGSGPGTFEYIFLKFRPEGFSGRPVFAHSDYLQLLSDCGVFAFAATLGLFTAIFRNGLRIIRRDESRLRFGVGAGVLAGFLSLAVHSVVDFNFHIPANWMMAAVLAGVLFSLDEKKFYTSKHSGQLFRFLMPALLLLLMSASIFFGSSDFFYRQSRNFFKEKNDLEALQSIDRSIGINGLDAEAYYLRGLILASQSKSSSAVKDFERAIVLNPYEPYYDFHKARQLFLDLPPVSGGILVSLYENAVAKDPRDSELRYSCGKELLVVSKQYGASVKAAAEKMLFQSLDLDPEIAESVYDLLWDHDYTVAQLQFLENNHPQGVSGFLRFLESHGLWRYHRKYYLRSLGIDTDALKRLSQATAWGPMENGEIFKGVVSKTQPIDHLFYPGGEIKKNIYISNPLVRLVLYAKGSLVGGAYPYIYVNMDGQPVDAIYLDSTEFRYFYVVFKMVVGRHVLSLRYVNDFGGRDIWVQEMSIETPKAGA